MTLQVQSMIIDYKITELPALAAILADISKLKPRDYQITELPALAAILADLNKLKELSDKGEQCRPHGPRYPRGSAARVSGSKRR